MNNPKLKWILPAALFMFVAGIFFLAKDSREKPSPAKEKANPCGIIFPKAKGYVNDFTYLFTEAERFQLDSVIEHHEKETTNQVAIITIDSAMLGKCNLEDYSLAIANEWGVGVKEKNNGIVICIAPQLQQIRIENGYGIEKIMSNQETKNILDSFFIPEFKKADYFNGTYRGLLEITRRLH